MKDIYRNPMLYYIGIPVLVALWPLLVWSVHLPGIRKQIKDNKASYSANAALMLDILALDPERATGAEETPREFSYSTEIYRVAGLCGIPASSCNLSSKTVVESGGQKTQSATVVLRDVNVVNFAKFLASLQFRWPGLETERIKLTKIKGVPDTWRADINFKYYF